VASEEVTQPNPPLPPVNHAVAPGPDSWLETISEIPLSLGDPLGTWQRGHDEVPPTIRDDLISIFASNRWLCAFEFSVPGLKIALKSNPASVHPAYLNAICLYACLHSRDSLRRLEPVFLNRTRRALAQSLADADRLLDFIRASALLGMCYIYTGRPTVGHHYIAGTLRFALACGLHEITSLDIPSRQHSLLEPPNNLAELGERINLFWMLYINDRAASIVYRLPVAMSDKLAQTMWPYPAPYYEVNYIGGGSDQIPIALDTDARTLEKNHCSYRAKAYFLLSMAYELASRVQALPDGRLTDSLLHDIGFAGAQIAKSACDLPPLPDTVVSAEYIDETVFPVNSLSVVLHHTAAITLYSLVADHDLRLRQWCLDSARTIVEVIARVSTIPLPCVGPLQIALALSWGPAFAVLARELEMNPDADVIRFDLDRLVDCMEGVARTATFLRPTVEKAVYKR